MRSDEKRERGRGRTAPVSYAEALTKVEKERQFRRRTAPIMPSRPRPSPRWDETSALKPATVHKRRLECFAGFVEHGETTSKVHHHCCQETETTAASSRLLGLRWVLGMDGEKTKINNNATQQTDLVFLYSFIAVTRTRTRTASPMLLQHLLVDVRVQRRSHIFASFQRVYRMANMVCCWLMMTC